MTLMDKAKRLILTVEHLISTKTKQHIVGGILFSVSVFLGALATTVLTMKVNITDDEQNNYQDEHKEDTDDYY
jgi:CYTH domain-containing protein